MICDNCYYNYISYNFVGKNLLKKLIAIVIMVMWKFLKKLIAMWKFIRTRIKSPSYFIFWDMYFHIFSG